MTKNKKQNTFYVNTNNSFKSETDFKGIIERHGPYWKWYLLSFLIAILVAIFYLRNTQKLYEVSSTILIEDKQNGSISSELSIFEDLGILSGTKNSMDTESGILKSRTLMQSVIKSLRYNVDYYKKDWLGFKEILTETNPYQINFFVEDSLFQNLNITLRVKGLSQTKFELLNENGEFISNGLYGEKVECGFGELIITPTLIIKSDFQEEIYVSIKPLKEVADGYKKALQVYPDSKKSNLLILTLKNSFVDRAKQILDRLVMQYNKNAVEDKSKIAKNTDTFINKRLDIISQDLSEVDLGIENFKTSNELTDLNAELSLMLQSNSSVDQKIIELKTQIKLIDNILEFVNNNEGELIPINSIMLSGSNRLNIDLNNETSNYNNLILERKRLSGSSNEKHPIIKKLNDQIADFRQSILQGLKNNKSLLKITLDENLKQDNLLNQKTSLAPKQEKEFRNILRQQQIVETLYLYLLKKREENSIILAATVPNAKVIDVADGSKIPISPRKSSVFLLVGIIGFIIPFSIIHLSYLLDNKVHSIEDIEDILKVPVLGEIPKADSDKKFVINNKSKNNVSESFRLLRTNVNFLLPKESKNSKTIFITSTLANEGKTFISINLASSLALLSKKVLIISADIRMPKISKYLNVHSENGLTNYLVDDSLKVSDIILNNDKFNFDIITSGPIPPNPSELLTNGRFEDLINYGKTNYDYTVIDTAPVNVVTDTLLLSQFADLSIYVVRAHFLDKQMLKVPKKMYKNKRLPNMAILINDTNRKHDYKYGYGGDQRNLSLWKRLTNK